MTSHNSILLSVRVGYVSEVGTTPNGRKEILEHAQGSIAWAPDDGPMVIVGET